jgi:hypothetical protein
MAAKHGPLSLAHKTAKHPQQKGPLVQRAFLF